MAQIHDKIGIACAGACAAHCVATAAGVLILAGGSSTGAPWLAGAHDWLMPLGLLMVLIGIVPALWKHRSAKVAWATMAGLCLWGLALLDPSHGLGSTALEVSGSTSLLAAHAMNMAAARRSLERNVARKQESERAADSYIAG